MNATREASREFLRAARIDTPLGSMRAVADGEGLRELVFDETAGTAEVKGSCDHPVLDQLRTELREYFAGARREFTVPLAMGGTEFQRSVWRELRRIPAGRTASYADVAARLGKPAATRAVGQANGANRIYLLIPCHRVIARDGTLGGYGAGAWRKRRLLELERTGMLPASV